MPATQLLGDKYLGLQGDNHNGVLPVYTVKGSKRKGSILLQIPICLPL